MAFNIKNFFKKKRQEDDFELGDSREEYEDIRMDSSNQFEKELGSIDTDGKDTRKGRKIKSKYVIGIAMLVALFGVGAVVSNLLSGEEQQAKKPKKIETAAKAAGVVNPLKTPSNYAELAKFEKKKADELAKEEEAKKKAAADAEAKKKAEEQERLEEEREKLRQRQVEMPRVNVNPGQAVGGFAQGVPGISQDEAKARTSALSFNTASGGGGVGGALSNYLPGGGPSRVDMGASYRIDAGTVIPATLLSGIISDGTNADVVAQVRQDVYDSLTGQHLLIPQGSRLLGVLAGTSNRRMGVSFHRLILPDGTSVALPKQKAVDKSGYGGMKDKYDTHDSTFFRGALISGVMAYLSDVVDDKMDNKGYTNERTEKTYSSAIKDTVNKINDRVLDRADRDANRNPTISIRPGFQFNVFINEDIQAYQYMR